MNANDHTRAAELHDLLLEGELDTTDERWLRDHRASCAPCAATFAGLERLVLALESLERPEPRPGFATRILEELRPAPVPAWARWRVSPGWGRLAAAGLVAAATLVVVLPQLVLDRVLVDVSGLGLVLRSPQIFANAIVTLLRELSPFSSLIEAGSALSRALLTTAASPPVLAALGAALAASGAAFRQLARLVATQPGNGPAGRNGRHVHLIFMV